MFIDGQQAVSHHTIDGATGDTTAAGNFGLRNKSGHRFHVTIMSRMQLLPKHSTMGRKTAHMQSFCAP